MSSYLYEMKDRCSNMRSVALDGQFRHPSHRCCQELDSTRLVYGKCGLLKRSVWTWLSVSVTMPQRFSLNSRFRGQNSSLEFPSLLLIPSFSNICCCSRDPLAKSLLITHLTQWQPQMMLDLSRIVLDIGLRMRPSCA
jgi:hypothetical protein